MVPVLVTELQHSAMEATVSLISPQPWQSYKCTLCNHQLSYIGTQLIIFGSYSLHFPMVEMESIR